MAKIIGFLAYLIGEVNLCHYDRQNSLVTILVDTPDKNFNINQNHIKIMSKKNQHVVPHGDQWAIRGEKNEKATKIVNTQSEAIKIAREISINQRSELIIHGTHGQIREKNSYGNDPVKTKG